MRAKDITAGVVTTIIMIASTVSYSAAVFSGPLAGYLQIGIGYGLLGACVTAAIFALTSDIPFAIAGPDSKPTAVLAALAASVALAGRVPGGNGGGGQALAAMALSALLFATILNGAILFLCGQLKVGRWVRFVPFPVVGGFMAASGWLLIMGAVRILTRVEPGLSTLGALARTDRLEQLAAGVIFAGALALARRSRYTLTFPAVLVGAAVLAHVVRHVMGVSVAQARDAGWLLQVPPGTLIPMVWLAHHWQVPHADLLLKETGVYVALIVVTAFTLMLGVTSVEVDAHLKDEIDVDRELRVNGIANVAVGLTGGMAGTLSLSRTLFNYQNGARSRLSGIIVAGGCLATLGFGTGALAYVPVLILGGMLLRLGVDLLDDWLIQGWKRMERTDFAQVVVILVAIIVWGFIAGVALGVITACVTFAVNTGRAGLVKQELDRTKYSGRVERSMSETRELIHHGGAIRIIWLHGFVFFGSVNNLLQHVKSLVSQPRPGVCRMVMLDFHGVLGIDSSAVMVLVRLRQFAERENFLLVLSGLLPGVESLLRSGGLLRQDNNTCVVFPALDAALEWCEDRLLQERMSSEEAKSSADEWLTREMGGQAIFRQLTGYLEKVSYAAGDALFVQGDPAEFLCLVYSGRVSIFFRTPEGQQLRLRSIQRHTLVGEMGLYRTVPRGASVLADQPTIVYRLSRQALERMEAENPPLATVFHRFVIRTLAERLDFANREVAALQG
jgi:SulP family sulfate permease